MNKSFERNLSFFFVLSAAAYSYIQTCPTTYHHGKEVRKRVKEWKVKEKVVLPLSELLALTAAAGHCPHKIHGLKQWQSWFPEPWTLGNEMETIFTQYNPTYRNQFLNLKAFLAALEALYKRILYISPNRERYLKQLFKHAVHCTVIPDSG